MKKISSIIIFLVMVIIGGFLAARLLSPEDTWLCKNGQWIKHGQPELPKPENGCGAKIYLGQDSKNATYFINGASIILSNGKFETVITDNSASKTITSVFNDAVNADINNDGLPDILVILSQTNGGSGTFYYLAAALNTADGYQGTNAVWLGDRIAPQTVEFKNNIIIANYAERNPGESMSVQPSLGVSKYLIWENNQLQEISYKNDLIEIKYPAPGAEVSSPLIVSGLARGNWFFEASFPVELRAENGQLIAQGIAQAQTDWMTKDFVPFQASLEFIKANQPQPGRLILKKDNPSGLPEYDDFIIVPIVY